MIVVTAATRWEARPLEKKLGDHKNLQVLRTGMGPLQAGRAVERLQLDESPLIVISSGLAGALQPDVRREDLVADFRETPLEFVQSARAVAEQLKFPLHFGGFLSSDRVLGPAEKRELGARHRALAIDMESGALRDWTKAHSGTFVALRAVLDELDDELPGEAPDEGAANALRFAAKHWRLLPTLIRLGLRQKRAMHRLSIFLDRWLRTAEFS